jgi:hypothetical protein
VKPRLTGRAVAWLARWGFAAMVAVGALAAVCIAWQVDVPTDVPSFALEAAPVYRLEVGAVIFAGGCIALLAFVLALNNRGFSELSATGVKAHDLESAAVDQVAEEHDESIDILTTAIHKLRDELRTTAEKASSLDDDDKR